MSSEIVFIIVTFCIGCIGIYASRQAKQFLASALKTEAIIVRNEYKRIGNNNGRYYPVVKFITAQQDEIIQQLRIGYMPEKKVGSKLEVVYEASHPTNVKANSTFQLKVVPWAAIILGWGGFITLILDFYGVIHIQ